MKAFDRDGVLVGVLGDWEACHPKRYQNGIEMPLIKEVIELINEPCIVFSNQQGIQRGYVSLETVINQFKWLMSKIPQIEACFFCPDDGFNCWVVDPWGVWDAWEVPSSYRIDFIPEDKWDTWEVPKHPTPEPGIKKAEILKDKWQSHWEVPSSYRKPEPGMAYLAKCLGFQINTYIGDLSGNPNYADGRDSDLKFAQNANLKYLDVNDFIEGESCKKH